MKFIVFPCGPIYSNLLKTHFPRFFIEFTKIIDFVMYLSVESILCLKLVQLIEDRASALLHSEN